MRFKNIPSLIYKNDQTHKKTDIVLQHIQCKLLHHLYVVDAGTPDDSRMDEDAELDSGNNHQTIQSVEMD